MPLTNPAILAAIASFLASIVMFSLAPSINSDAVIYLSAADAFIENGWSAAESIYPRPLYASLIGGFSLIFGISSLAAAKFITASLAATTAYAFVKLVDIMGGNKVAQQVAALMIVVYPGLGAYKAYIIRDFGYWAFTLLMLGSFIRYQLSGQWKQLSLWLTFSMAATLFRPEAAAIAAVLPLSLLFCQNKTIANRLTLIGYIYGVTIFSLFIILAIGQIANIDIADKLYKLALEQPLTIVTRLMEKWESLSTALSQATLNKYSEKYADLALFLTYMGIFCGHMLGGLSWPILVTALYIIIKKKWIWPTVPSYWTMVLTTCAILLLFIIDRQFLQTRYILLTCLLLLVPLSISIGAFIQNTKLERFQKQILIGLTFIAFIDAHFSFGHSKTYIADSIDWIKVNTLENERLLSNDIQISYRSGRPFTLEQVRRMSGMKNIEPNHLPKNYTYIAWKSGFKSSPPEKFTSGNSTYVKTAQFSNKRGDNVSIYSNLPEDRTLGQKAE